jgi:hypothetical protein
MVPLARATVTSLRSPVALVVVAWLAIAAPVAGQSVTFVRIANTSTAIPSGSGNFTDFGFPSVSGGRVSFQGLGTAGQQGVYTDAGGTLAAVANTSTPIPSGTGNFTGFLGTSLSGGRVAFNGSGTGQQGIYTEASGTLTAVANRTTSIPSGTGTFTLFGIPSLSNGRVAFRGDGSGGQQGIYSDVGGSLAAVANQSTPIPSGSGNFASFGTIPSLSNVRVAFLGGGGGQGGIYTDAGGTLAAVADLNTPIPGGSGNFTSFIGNPSLSDGRVAFFGRGGGGQQGIYTNAGGPLTAVADTSTPIPSGTGTFTGFSPEPTIANGFVAFQGTGASLQSGIYTNVTGSLTKVIATGDMLDGLTVSGLSFGLTGLSGNQVVFVANFTNMTSGVYLATAVPEPVGVLGLCAVAAATLRLVRRGRGRDISELPAAQR